MKIIRNKQTGQPEGYGFIEFGNHALAEQVLQNYNGQMMPNVNQPFKLNWATSGAGEKRGDDGSDYTIFVGDLASDVTDFILQDTFKSRYPSVKSAKVVFDRTTGRSKGYGFVKFADLDEQTRAMTEMNGQYCSSRPMRLGPASNKKNTGGQPQPSSSMHPYFLSRIFYSVSGIYLCTPKFIPSFNLVSSILYLLGIDSPSLFMRSLKYIYILLCYFCVCALRYYFSMS